MTYAVRTAPAHEDRGNAPTGRTSRRRPDQGAFGSLLHHAARRPRRRGDQGGAARKRRRHARLCAAVSGRPGGLFPLRQPQQEEHHARHEERPGQGGALAPDRSVRHAGRELPPRRHGSPGLRLRGGEEAPAVDGLRLDLGFRRHRPAKGPSRLRRHRAGRSRHHGHHRPARRRAAQGRRGDRRPRVGLVRRAGHPGGAATRANATGAGQHVQHLHVRGGGLAPDLQRQHLLRHRQFAPPPRQRASHHRALRDLRGRRRLDQPRRRQRRSLAALLRGGRAARSRGRCALRQGIRSRAQPRGAGAAGQGR